MFRSLLRTTQASSSSLLPPRVIEAMTAHTNGAPKPALPDNTQKNPTRDAAVVPFSSRLRSGRALALDVWSIYNAANLPTDCINLGQGYMNFAPPQWVKDAASEALSTVAANHYSHPKGRIRLREAIRDFYSADFNRQLDVESEILVSSGANEGQYAMFTAFLEPEDEVIMFEPWFDQYLPSITFNGGVPVYVPLHPPPPSQGCSTADDWKINFDELRRAFSPKTKMVIVNTPQNPVGKVFTHDELNKIADLAKEFNALVMADEVYDCLLYEDREHIRIANLPGMWERTVTVGSAGSMYIQKFCGDGQPTGTILESFAATGWRVGWLVGHPTLIGPILAATTRIVFCTNSPMQEAAAAGLEQANNRGYFSQQRKEYEERRNILLRGFDKLGMRYTVPQGSYFILLDISDVAIPENYPFPESIHGRGKDFKACWFIAMEIGVSSIPVSEFYGDVNRSIGERFARFAFCKDKELLQQAADRLQGLKKYLR